MDTHEHTPSAAGEAVPEQSVFAASDLGRWVVRTVADLLFPPECLTCRTLVADPGLLCSACWERIHFIAGPVCVQCGTPFELDLGPETTCAVCIASPPKYDQARSVMIYDDASKQLVLAFKYRDRLDGARSYATWMLRAAAPLLDKADVIVPVPMHHWRRISRKYNQAAVLAQSLGTLSGKPVWPMVLRQTRATHGQKGLSGTARRRSVAGAFEIRDSSKAQIRGKRVLLIDDVLTTGATVDACAGVLRRAGASGVDVATLARVVREQTV